jgi:nicotinamidase-related amidase
MPDDIPVVEPVAVEVEAAHTALLVMDITDPICTKRASCVATVPAVAALLERCRTAGVRIIHTTSLGPATFLDPVLPRPDEPVIAAKADKFFGSELEAHLRESDSTTLVLVGTAANGALLYTSFAAVVRGFTVAVAADCASSDSKAITRWALWQVLNQPGLANPTNTPLLSGRVTVTTSTTISLV